MENNHLNSPNFLHKRQGKDKHFEAQMKRVFAAFKCKLTHYRHEFIYPTLKAVLI